jgi:predicted lactoylglutathione lyase
MKKYLLILTGLLLSFFGGYFIKSAKVEQTDKTIIRKSETEQMKLGAFSVSLSVKDLETSKRFYEALGFTQFAGSLEQNYLIMKNGNSLIGLFQGMFEGNILTFNPGWDENASTLQQFEDIRAIQRKLKASGIKLETEADEKTTGPASLTIKDPDGNVILLDQHR